MNRGAEGCVGCRGGGGFTAGNEDEGYGQGWDQSF